MQKRILSLCLILVLLLTMLTGMVFATNDSDRDDEADGFEDTMDSWTEDLGDGSDDPELWEDEQDTNGSEYTEVLGDPEESERPAKDPVRPVFPDVQPGDWFYDNVMALYEAGVIDGFTDGTFRPASKVTTGQALKMILLAAGYPEPDPVASHWARGYLNLAIEEGILVRYEISDLDVSISRGMVAKIAALALGLERESEENYFTDTDDDYTQALYEAGITNGYTDGSFLPKRTLSRAELSAIVDRINSYNASSKDEKEEDPDEQPDDSGIELRTTEKCIEMLKKLEGFVSMPYWDYMQYSIGYGSYCDPADYPNGITEKEADLLLRKFVQGFEKDLDAFLAKNDIELTDSQYDALVLFTYNLGSIWMYNTTISQLLASGDYTENEFASAYGVWCHVGADAQVHKGLIDRRVRELRMFFDNDYTNPKEDTFYYVIYCSDKGEIDTDVGLYREGTHYEPLFGAECRGDEFLGWFTEDGRQITEDDIATENLTVYARWRSDYDDTYEDEYEEEPDEDFSDEFEGGGIGDDWFWE